MQMDKVCCRNSILKVVRYTVDRLYICVDSADTQYTVTIQKKISQNLKYGEPITYRLYQKQEPQPSNPHFWNNHAPVSFVVFTDIFNLQSFSCEKT